MILSLFYTNSCIVILQLSTVYVFLVAIFFKVKELAFTVKDAMPVSFRSELFTSYILTIFKQCNPLPHKCETAKYSYACKILQKKVFVVNVLPATSTVFI